MLGKSGAAQCGVETNKEPENENFFEAWWSRYAPLRAFGATRPPVIAFMKFFVG
jgi:hypothetical protein